MKNINFYLFLLLVCLLTSACEVATVKPQSASFFDIDDFLEKERATLSKISSIEKTVAINEETDTKTLTAFNLENDFKIFSNTNINKLVWIDKYRVDSTLNSDGILTTLKYTALVDKLKTREMLVEFEEAEVKEIFIKNASDNQVSTLIQNLHYFAGQGYSVESIQDITLGGEQTLKVNVKYLR